jgi:hypothetical protein
MYCGWGVRVLYGEIVREIVESLPCNTRHKMKDTRFDYENDRTTTMTMVVLAVGALLCCGVASAARCMLCRHCLEGAFARLVKSASHELSDD